MYLTSLSPVTLASQCRRKIKSPKVTQNNFFRVTVCKVVLAIFNQNGLLEISLSQQERQPFFSGSVDGYTNMQRSGGTSK